MTLNAVQIGEVLQEIRPALVGCTLESLFQPERDAVVLIMASGEVRRRVLFSLEWWGSRVHLVSRHLNSIKTPQPFFAGLQKALQGSALSEIGQVNGDRIVDMRFVSAEGAEARLVVELMGPVSNAYLLDASGKIEHTHRRKFAGRREFKPGDAYVCPAAPAAAKHETLRERFPAEAAVGEWPLSGVLEAAYEALGRERAAEERRRTMLDKLQGARKKWQAKIEAMERELAESAGYEREFQFGEIIKANLGNISPRAKEITADNLFGEGKVTIPLDETMTPVENMERQFRRAQKMKAGEPVIRSRLEKAKNEMAAIDAALEKAAKGELGEEDLPALLFTRRRQQAQAKPKEKKRAAPGLEFRSKDGFSILVGRNNAENDKLTMQVARGNDVWMHVQHQTGSHVVVPVPHGKTISLDTLLDAANLAGYFSKIRSARKIPVDYTYVKYVRKPRKAEVGMVTYSNNKTIIVAPDSERLKRLLEKEA
jgi:predicted ribosome quality control (RQC) complex YloA/Tae2 family protein